MLTVVFDGILADADYSFEPDWYTIGYTIRTFEYLPTPKKKNKELRQKRKAKKNAEIKILQNISENVPEIFVDKNPVYSVQVNEMR